MVVLVGLNYWVASAITMYFMIVCDSVTCGINFVTFLVTTPLFRERVRNLICPVKRADQRAIQPAQHAPSAPSAAAASAPTAPTATTAPTTTTQPDRKTGNKSLSLSVSVNYPCNKNDQPVHARRTTIHSTGKTMHQGMHRRNMALWCNPVNVESGKMRML